MITNAPKYCLFLAYHSSGTAISTIQYYYYSYRHSYTVKRLVILRKTTLFPNGLVLDAGLLLGWPRCGDKLCLNLSASTIGAKLESACDEHLQPAFSTPPLWRSFISQDAFAKSQGSLVPNLVLCGLRVDE